MSNQQQRQRQFIEAEHQIERRRAIEAPRHPHDERWGYWGIGVLRVQLIRRPAFGVGVCYEVRGEFGNLRLFRSRTSPHDKELFVGHEKLDAKPSFLYRILRGFEEITVPLHLPRVDYGVLDGERFEFAIFAGMVIAARFMWRRGEVAPGWEPLVQLSETLIKDFDTREVIDERSSAS